MKIYDVDADHDVYDACHVDYDACAKEHSGIDKYDMMIRLWGRSVSDVWWPRIMKRYDEGPLADYISSLSGDVIIMRREAIEKIRHILGDIELLPLECDFGDYWAINVLTVLDCVDYTNSEYDCFPQTDPTTPPRIMCFNKYAFHPEKIQGYHIFRLKDIPPSHIFVDEVFMDEIAKHNITGFKCPLVWEG